MTKGSIGEEISNAYADCVLNLCYSLIRLDNGLEAMIISDPTTDKAAASLSVRVGHLSDPVRVLSIFSF